MEEPIALGLTTAAEQPRSASIVIIGGGIVAASIAWHLASSGVRGIVVVERSEFGSGSSAKPLGGVRANFSDPSNIRLGQRSLDAFGRFEDEFGIDIGLENVGYLFLCRNEEQLSSMAEAVVIQNEMGVRSSILTPNEVSQANPFVDPAALAGASYSPHDGFARPARVVEGYVRAAQELGVTFLNRTEVLSIRTAGEQIQAVVTNRGEIMTESIFCCAGAWSGAIGAMVGIDLPVEPVRRLIGFTGDWDVRPPTVPFTLDLSTTMYFHNAGDGLLMGISHEQTAGFCREFSYEWLQEFRAAASTCAPSLADKEIVKGWAGLYENTPDRNALIGRADSLPGFFYATGFSGHGFVQAPAVGELMVDLYAGRPSFMDAEPFSHERFAQDAPPMRETNII